MARKSLGYTKLEWTCPNCGGRNPGPEKTCRGCGAPQPENVQFEQVEHQEIIQDKTEIEKAKSGADIHCPFCGARNPAGTETCTQCGGDIKEGVRRETGRVVGAFKTGPQKQIPCPSCGALNPENSLKCNGCGATLSLAPPKPVVPPAPAPKKTNLILLAALGLIGLCIVCLVIFGVLSMRTEGVTGEVQQLQWTTSIAIEAIRPATRQDWRDSIPADATNIGNCSQKMHHVQNEPAPNAVEVCGTPYTVDQGSGYAEVVQDCQYEIYQDFCEYTVMEWQTIDTASLQGNDLKPAWAQPQLANDERLGERQETYRITFNTSKGQYTYTTKDVNLYQQCRIGSKWLLNINTFNQVVSIEPAY